MARQTESPRFILILGGLFLITYAAYQVGSAWMDAHPPSIPTPTQVQPYPDPEPAITPAEPYPGVETAETPFQPYPDPVITSTPAQLYPEPEVTDTPAEPYPELETTNTPANTLPTATPTNAGATPTQVQSTATPTLEKLPTITPTNLPTPTSDGGAYPGPEKTATSDPNDPYPGPGQTATSDPNNPYPGPEKTSTPESAVTSNPGDPYPGPEFTFTPTPSPTAQPNTPTPTMVPPPTFESPPTTFTTLPYTETQIISGGTVNQVIWLDNELDLAMATSGGIYLYQPFGDEPNILDSGSPIISIAHITNNDWIAAGGGDSLIRLFDRSTGSFVRNLSGHLLGVVRLSYAPFGNFLASASDDATVRIWNDDGSPQQTLRGPITRVVDMVVSSNGRMVAAASNQHLHIWNPQTAELLHTISQPDGWYTAATFSPNGQILTTAFNGQRLEFWDSITWERINFAPLDGAIQTLTYHPDGHLLAIGYLDGRIQIRDSSYEYLLADLSSHQEITSMAFSPYQDQLITSSANGSIRIWDLTPMLEP